MFINNKVNKKLPAALNIGFIAYIKDNCYTYVANTNGLSFTHRKQADKMGEEVVNKYASKIIDKYSESNFKRICMYGNVIDKYPNYKISFKIFLFVLILYKFPLFLIKLLPSKKLRCFLRKQCKKA